MALVADPQHLPQPVVIALPAQIDMANAGRAGRELGSALTPRRHNGHRRHDGHHVCDSSGISMPIRAHKTCCDQQNRVAAGSALRSGPARTLGGDGTLVEFATGNRGKLTLHVLSLVSRGGGG